MGHDPTPQSGESEKMVLKKPSDRHDFVVGYFFREKAGRIHYIAFPTKWHAYSDQ